MMSCVCCYRPEKACYGWVKYNFRLGNLDFGLLCFGLGIWEWGFESCGLGIGDCFVLDCGIGNLDFVFYPLPPERGN